MIRDHKKDKLEKAIKKYVLHFKDKSPLKLMLARKQILEASTVDKKEKILDNLTRELNIYYDYDKEQRGDFQAGYYVNLFSE